MILFQYFVTLGYVSTLYIVFTFRLIAQRIGRWLKLKEKRPEPVEKIPALEEAFKRYKKLLPTDQASLDVS